jgi:hypothetical protein
MVFAHLQPRQRLLSLAGLFKARKMVSHYVWRRVATVEFERTVQSSLTRRGNGWGWLSHPALKRRAKFTSPLRGGCRHTRQLVQHEKRANDPSRRI